jgi:3-phenylpropionate/cinnamic acid dioxygenase small subunit
MSIARIVAVCMLSAGFLQIAAPPARADDAQLLQEMRDRAAIETLMWRYARALDSMDAKGYAAAFTPDGKFGSGQTAREGRAALEAMVTELKAGRAEREAKGEPPSPPMYHVIANHAVEFIDRDHARYEAYWMTVFGARGQEVPVRVAAAGRSVDMLVRVNGEWLIQSRDVAPQ